MRKQNNRTTKSTKEVIYTGSTKEQLAAQDGKAGAADGQQVKAADAPEKQEGKISPKKQAERGLRT